MKSKGQWSWSDGEPEDHVGEWAKSRGASWTLWALWTVLLIASLIWAGGMSLGSAGCYSYNSPACENYIVAAMIAQVAIPIVAGIFGVRRNSLRTAYFGLLLGSIVSALLYNAAFGGS